MDIKEKITKAKRMTFVGMMNDEAASIAASYIPKRIANSLSVEDLALLVASFHTAIEMVDIKNELRAQRAQ